MKAVASATGLRYCHYHNQAVARQPGTPSPSHTPLRPLRHLLAPGHTALPAWRIPHASHRSQARRQQLVVRGEHRYNAPFRRMHSEMHKTRPLTAWSPLRSAFSLTRFFGTAAAAAAAAWFLHPVLLEFAKESLHLDFKDSVTAFQTSFFSFLSLAFAIYSGNTMAFLYDRQKELVKCLYAEVMALEELVDEAVICLGPDARDILSSVRKYIEMEIMVPENQSPPLGEQYALSAIRTKVRNYKRAGADVGDILAATQDLAERQSVRQATACRLLPPVHWALLYSIGVMFALSFLLFESGGSFSNEGRHLLFTVLCAVMALMLSAVRDLADPSKGVYNATALLEERLEYTRNMLKRYQLKQPGQGEAPPETGGHRQVKLGDYMAGAIGADLAKLSMAGSALEVSPVAGKPAGEKPSPVARHGGPKLPQPGPAQKRKPTAAPAAVSSNSNGSSTNSSSSNGAQQAAEGNGASSPLEAEQSAAEAVEGEASEVLASQPEGEKAVCRSELPQVGTAPERAAASMDA